LPDLAGLSPLGRSNFGDVLVLTILSPSILTPPLFGIAFFFPARRQPGRLRRRLHRLPIFDYVLYLGSLVWCVETRLPGETVFPPPFPDNGISILLATAPPLLLPWPIASTIASVLVLSLWSSPRRMVSGSLSSALAVSSGRGLPAICLAFTSPVDRYRLGAILQRLKLKSAFL